jgi:hypothetical protein
MIGVENDVYHNVIYFLLTWIVRNCMELLSCNDVVGVD